MGKLKKGGEDTRGMKAKAQKKEAMAAKQAQAQERKNAEEDAKWQEGTNSRQAKKASEAAAKEAARLAKKEAKAAALAAEEAELGKMRAPKGKARKAAKSKKKKNDLSLLNEFLAEEEKGKKKQEKAKLKAQDPLSHNPNRQRAEEEAAGIYNASGIENAINALEIANKTEKPTEKSLKAAFMEYEEKMMPTLRKDYPSLKRSQLKDKLWKQWQKSAENPLNSVESSGN
mmetsp:Transcript_1784/g.2535  ORF Transcript_1784/g.2535 Transcript_1784/m.2535 type:complete len:229 (+) Transcript_1784:132-818(+)